jgi:acyl-CoA thioester hydrolase
MRENEMLVVPRFAEVDMISVVHHSRYWVWFEEAKFHFLESIFGITPQDIASSNIYLPVIDCKCSYLSSVKWKDRIKIITKMNIDSTSSLEFNHEAYSDNEANKRLICRAYVKHAFVDQNFNLKLRIPLLFKNAIDRNKEKSFAFF